MFLTYSKIGNLQWDGKRREYQKKACFKTIPFLQFYIKEEEEEEEAFSMRKENELNCLINKIFLAPVSSTSVQEKSVACFMMWKKKKKRKRISHVSGGSFHGATEKMGTRFFGEVFSCAPPL